MKSLKRKFRAIAARWLIRFFCHAIKGVILWENQMAKQDECKHEGQEGTFCGLCGTSLKDPDETMLENVMERVLTKHGVIKPKKAGEPEKRGSLIDRLNKGNKK